MTDELPDGWRWVKLGDICIEERENISRDDPLYESLPYLGLEHIESETGRILTDANTGLFSGTKSNNFKFAPDHVLYGKLRPYLNKVSLPSFAGRCTTEIIPLRPVGVNRDWLAWLLRRQDTVDYAMRGKTGSRMPRTAMRDLMRMPIPLPPLDEQRRIVNQLEAQLAAAQRAQRAAQAQLDALDALPAALLREIFPRSPAARLPRGWRWVKLGDVCEIVNGSTPKSDVEEYWGGDVCWITPTDLGSLNGSSIERCARPITQSGYDSCSTTIVPIGSVVMSSRAPIGHLGIARTELCTNQGCKSFVLQESIITKFLYYSLKNSLNEIRALGSGATFTEVSKSKLEQFAVPLPPLDDQHRIVQQLEVQLGATNRASHAAQSQFNVLDVLPTALLRLVFSM